MDLRRLSIQTCSLMQVTNQRGAAPLEIGNEFLFHCYLFPVPPAGLSFCAGAGLGRGAAPPETGNEFLFHCYLFPVPLPHNANPKRESKDKNGMWILPKSARKVGFSVCSNKKNPKTLLTLNIYEYLCKVIYNVE